MSTAHPNQTDPALPNRSQCQIPPEILISVACGPLLLGLLASKALTKVLSEVGQTSEEIFRGTRLPVLHFPPTEQKTQGGEALGITEED